MRTYICVVLDCRRAVETAEVISADGDECARDKALSIIGRRGRGYGYELWQRGRIAGEFHPVASSDDTDSGLSDLRSPKRS